MRKTSHLLSKSHWWLTSFEKERDLQLSTENVVVIIVINFLSCRLQFKTVVDCHVTPWVTPCVTWRFSVPVALLAPSPPWPVTQFLGTHHRYPKRKKKLNYFRKWSLSSCLHTVHSLWRKCHDRSSLKGTGTTGSYRFLLTSGGSRGGARGNMPPPLILGKKEQITEERKASRASKTPPPPPPLAQGSAIVEA